jgi:hypothetical protein
LTTTATLAAAATAAMVVAIAAVSALAAVFAAGVLSLTAGLSVGAGLATATVFTAEAAAALTALATVALAATTAAMMTATATTLTTIAVETAFAAGVALISWFLGSGGFAAEETFDPGDQTAAGLLLFDWSRGVGDRRRGAGLFLEAAWFAGLAWLARVTRIARLTWLALITRVTRLALFAEIAALLRLGFFGTRSFAASGCRTVLSGFGIALAMTLGAEDRAIAATVTRVLIIVGLLSTGGERGAFPALSGAHFVLGWKDFELGLFGGLGGRHGSRFRRGGYRLGGGWDFGCGSRAGGGRGLRSDDGCCGFYGFYDGSRCDGLGGGFRSERIFVFALARDDLNGRGAVLAGGGVGVAVGGGGGAGAFAAGEAGASAGPKRCGDGGRSDLCGIRDRRWRRANGLGGCHRGFAGRCCI